MSKLPAPLRREILDACKVLTHFHMVEGFGHVSARLPDGERIAVTPRTALALVKAEDIVELTIDGRQVGGNGRPPLETPMHLAVYRRRPEVQAICRAHPRHVAAFASAVEPLRCSHGFGASLGAIVPVFDEPVLIDSPELGGRVAEVLASGDGVILRGNGMLAVGQSVPDAVVRALFMEEMAEIDLMARGASLEPAYMTPEQVILRRGTDLPHEPVRAWEFYRAVALGEAP